MAGGDSKSGDRRPEPGSIAPAWVVRIAPWAWRHARKLVIGIIGGTILLIGVAFLVLPGPGILTIIIGLAILATEYAFARRWLRTARERAKAMSDFTQNHVRRRVRWRPSATPTTQPPPPPPPHPAPQAPIER